MNGIPDAPAAPAASAMPMVLYEPVPGARDEAVAADGTISPAWSEFFESCQRHGLEGLREWREAALRISRDRGLAYRPDRGEGAQWSLDPVPWIFSHEEWAQLEEGVAQLLRLYSAILADLYGAQTLLERSLLPASIVLGHRGYLRALHDYPPGEKAFGLGLSAFDLARSSDGGAFLLNGRFDCPYGFGVALENRTVINRVLPNLFRRCQVRRIGYFFNDWFSYLAGRAPAATEGQPRIVILDSDPGGESSEIAFLANYCGITRAVPSDLTVRGAKVWLKTLRGLKPVDVIWKVTHGRDLDPLEAAWRFAAEGVPGMFEAMREGNVTVASHPGAELIQSPGLLPFLGPICRELLGEELKLTPAATWWCGDPAARSHVLSQLSQMVVKSVGHHSDFPTVYGERLSSRELADLAARIEAEPHRYVGQDQLEIPTVPVSRDEGLVPRGAVLRSFAFVDAAGEPRVMPGGLGRVGTEEGVIVSTRASGESKDVWIRSPVPDPPISIERLLERTRAISPEVVPSRRGENLYWAGRYGERTDTLARFANRLVAGRTSGFSYGRAVEAEHERLLGEALFHIFEAEEYLAVAKGSDARLALVLADPGCPVGIAPNLEFFHRASMAAREEWSLTSIFAIESAKARWFAEAGGPFGSPYRYEPALQNLALHLAAFHGLNLDSMTRDEAWGLLDAGGRIERAGILLGLLVRLLELDEPEPLGTLLNESVLFVADSLGTYQSQFLAVPTTALTLRLLLGEEDYPRSLRYLLERLEHVLAKLEPPATGPHPGARLAPIRLELERFVESLGEAPATEDFPREEALELLQTWRAGLVDLHDDLTTSYFSHAGARG